MKLWMKIFIGTFILFTAYFYTGIFFMSQLSYQNSLHTAREQAVTQQNFILASYSKDLQAIAGRKQGDELSQAIASLTEYYTQSYQNVSLQLFQDGQPINKISQKLQIPGTVLKPSGSLSSTVLEDENRKYILVGGTVLDKYVLVYVQDITLLMDAQNRLLQELLLLGTGIELFLAVTLFVLMRKLTKPVKILQDATAKIASGEYDVRADVKGSDEIAALAVHFNDMAKEVSSRIEEQKKIACQKQQFIDNLAHELKTPLTSIYSSAELLQTTRFSGDDLLDSTSQIMRQVKRIQEMSKTLLDMAQNRKFSIEKKPVPLCPLFQKIQSEMAPALKSKNIDLIISCNAGSVEGDPVLLESLLTNLLDNAIKASAPHGTIYLFSFQKNGSVTIELRDQGKGIAPEHLEFIFDPFYRTDFARAKEEHSGGTGLGLALCKQIADMHGAEIDVQSVLKEGTSFSITFYSSVTTS